MSPKPPRRPPAKGPRPPAKGPQKGKSFRESPENRDSRVGYKGGDSRSEPTSRGRSGAPASPRDFRGKQPGNKGLDASEGPARRAAAGRGPARPPAQGRDRDMDRDRPYERARPAERERPREGAFSPNRGQGAAGRGRDRDRDDGPRPRSGDGWIYGHHAVAAALANPIRQIQQLILTRDAEETLGAAGIALRIAPEIRASAEISALLPDGAAHQGFALRAAPLPGIGIAEVLSRLKDGAPALVVVLDQVTDPRNVGAILRSAAAFGAAAVILPERHGADTTAAMAKTASGALETVALVRVTNISRTLEALKAGGFWCVGLDAHAPEVLASVDLTGRVALVMGSEGSGLRRLVRDTCDLHARLPIGEGMESLNVSAAAAIAMYEVARRRA